MKPSEIQKNIEQLRKANTTSEQKQEFAYALGILFGFTLSVILAWLGYNYVSPLFSLPKLNFLQFLSGGYVIWFIRTKLK